MFLVTILFLTISSAASQEPQKYPQGQYKGGEDIKFHDPNDFRQQQQQHHTHSLRGNPDHDKEHLKTHTREEYIDVEGLSEPQMIMQHFRNYDLDKNGNIDGLEILKAAYKMNEDHASDPSMVMMTLEEMAPDADETLRAYDDNNDGLVHYGEFYRNHQRALHEASKTASEGHN